MRKLTRVTGPHLDRGENKNLIKTFAWPGFAILHVRTCELAMILSFL